MSLLSTNDQILDQHTQSAQVDSREPTKSASLTEQLIEAIVTGTYPAGTKVSEAGLATAFGVSRGPLREAMMRVEALGLVERVPHVGARVVTLTHRQLAEIYAVREALEGMAARLACAHITDAEIEQLSAVLDTHHAYIERVDGAAYFHQQGDFDFHYCIIKASHNQKLITLLCGELYHLLRMYRFQSPRAHSRPQQALQEHMQILTAIRERDAELAEMLMRRHIQRSRQLIEQQITD